MWIICVKEGGREGGDTRSSPVNQIKNATKTKTVWLSFTFDSIVSYSRALDSRRFPGQTRSGPGCCFGSLLSILVHKEPALGLLVGQALPEVSRPVTDGRKYLNLFRDHFFQLLTVSWGQIEGNQTGSIPTYTFTTIAILLTILVIIDFVGHVE